MGIERTRPPRYWRRRAEQFRIKADRLEQQEEREDLFKIARHYDDLARRAERIRTVQGVVE
jgi:thymidylate kinase